MQKDENAYKVAQLRDGICGEINFISDVYIQYEDIRSPVCGRC